MHPGIFKAYDVRGIYPDELNEEDVLLIAAAVGRRFKKGKVIIGHDARTSSPRLAKVAYGGLSIAKTKGDIIDAGLITTPMLYFLVNHLHAAGGVMVTASHNPKEYNGLKVVGPKASPVSGAALKKIVFENRRT